MHISKHHSKYFVICATAHLLFYISKQNAEICCGPIRTTVKTINGKLQLQVATMASKHLYIII